MGAGVITAYAASGVLGLVFAPVVLAHILRSAARGPDPIAGSDAPRRDHVGRAMIAVVIMVVFACSLLVALAVWLSGSATRIAPTLLRFVCVALAIALLAPSARREVV
jgi:hypothetical protein